MFCVFAQLWNLDEPWLGPAPGLLRAVKAFPAAAKLPESPVTAVAVQEASWPHFMAALGLANGQLCMLRGDIGGRRGFPRLQTASLFCERLQTTSVQMLHDSNNCAHACTDLVQFRTDVTTTSAHKVRVPARAGREKVQRSVLSVREGPTADEVVGLAFKGVLFFICCSHCAVYTRMTIG